MNLVKSFGNLEYLLALLVLFAVHIMESRRKTRDKRHFEVDIHVSLIVSSDKIKDIARSTVPDGSEAILYGSRARGDARSDSDWDILILLNKDRLTQNDYDNVSYPFVMLGCNLGAEINPILYTKKEWETYQFTPFYENVNRDGIILA